MWRTLNRVNLTVKKKRKKGESESRTPFVKNLLGASVRPGSESDVWPTMPSSEQRGLSKNMMLVGTIIVLVALARLRRYCYCCSHACFIDGLFLHWL